MKTKLLTLALVSLNLAGYGQNNEESESRLLVKSISIQTGLFTNVMEGQNNLNDFRKLAPTSDLLKTDLNSLDYSYTTTINSNGPALVANIILVNNSNKSNKRLNQEIHLGFVYNSMVISSLNVFEESSFRVDTLTSSQTGNQSFVDSVSIESLSGDFTQNQLFLSSAYVVSSNPENRLKFYAGIGVGAGLSISASTNINYFKSNFLDSEATGRNSNPDRNEDFQSKSERFSNRNSFVGRIFVPIGLDLKLSKKNASWSKCHLLLETQPNLTYVSTPMLTSKVETGNISSIGFRYDF
jgi:hypothetical protein